MMQNVLLPNTFGSFTWFCCHCSKEEVKNYAVKNAIYVAGWKDGRAVLLAVLALSTWHSSMESFKNLQT
jgi:hypothetical protein